MSGSSAMIFWFTGLSGSGKTTIAQSVQSQLSQNNLRVLLLDGDDVRDRFHRHLGFSEADIKENNRLMQQLGRENQDQYDVILVPIISPYASSRAAGKKLFGSRFFEVYINAEPETVIERDTKGMYAKARRGEIDNLIGFSPNSPYEPPTDADIVLNTSKESELESVNRLLEFINMQLKLVVQS
ncbi:MAG: adenylyl-sulfate kinase [Magnetococcales bacterium]|nr:adenylyl-sulfate kinase [Magnetococcales bacterium]